VGSTIDMEITVSYLNSIAFKQVFPIRVKEACFGENCF